MYSNQKIDMVGCKNSSKSKENLKLSENTPDVEKNSQFYVRLKVEVYAICFVDRRHKEVFLFGVIF